MEADVGGDNWASQGSSLETHDNDKDPLVAWQGACEDGGGRAHLEAQQMACIGNGDPQTQMVEDLQ